MLLYRLRVHALWYPLHRRLCSNTSIAHMNLFEFIHIDVFVTRKLLRIYVKSCHFVNTYISALLIEKIFTNVLRILRLSTYV